MSLPLKWGHASLTPWESQVARDQARSAKKQPSSRVKVLLAVWGIALSSWAGLL